MEFLDKNQLRSAVSLAAVAAELGVLVDELGQAPCPFHEDTHPSFHLFLDNAGVERWACYPCGTRGDCYDLIRGLTGCSFPASVEWVEERAHRLPPPPPRDKPWTFDADLCNVLVQEARGRSLEPDIAGWMCVHAGIVDPTAGELTRQAADQHLRDHWRWGVGSSGELVFPHYNAYGTLTGAKMRAVDGAKWAFPGSVFHALYGAWRTRRHRTVVLCEGETDAAWASMQDPAADVLGLPTGAGRFLDVWAQLEADVYWLAFDADDQGRAADERWRAALAGKDVRTVPVPEGSDLKEARVRLPDM